MLNIATSAKVGRDHGISQKFSLAQPHAPPPLTSRAADFPCYTFERDFSDVNSVLLEDFSVPDFFQDDVYALSQELR